MKPNGPRFGGAVTLFIGGPLFEVGGPLPVGGPIFIFPNDCVGGPLFGGGLPIILLLGGGTPRPIGGIELFVGGLPIGGCPICPIGGGRPICPMGGGRPICPMGGCPIMFGGP